MTHDLNYSVSVVIPMYNSEKTIKATLQSVLEQTILPQEIIVVNDGSKDNSLEVADDFIKSNSLVPITLINKPNGGVSSARNLGIKSAKSTYVAFLDSDDKWLPQKLERQLEQLKKNNTIDLLATNRNEEHFENFLGHSFSNLTKISSKLLLFKNFFSPPTVIIKKSVTDKVGFFDESQRYAEEGDYWIRFCLNNNCYLLNESLVVTGDGKPHFGHSGLSSNLWEMEKGELKNIRTAYKLKIINPFEFIFLYFFSILKYFRRVFIVKFKR